MYAVKLKFETSSTAANDVQVCVRVSFSSSSSFTSFIFFHARVIVHCVQLNNIAEIASNYEWYMVSILTHRIICTAIQIHIANAAIWACYVRIDFEHIKQFYG